MDISTISIVVLSTLIGSIPVIYFAYRIGVKNRHVLAPSHIERSEQVSVSNETSILTNEDVYNSSQALSVIDESGIVVISSNEISKMPSNSRELSSSDSAIRQTRHLVTDLFKGVVSTPNKTIELVFKKEIQEGINNGTYTLLKTKAGETLADARGPAGKIVGKGRIFDGGKIRQLASGAFQLVSIAVAQSHLADINKSLNSIKDSMEEVLNKLENEDKTKISGAIDYLKNIAEHMKNLKLPSEISDEKSLQLEAIIRESFSWRNKIHEDFKSLIESISKQKDIDYFGTGDTHKQLKNLIEKARPLSDRHELLMQLLSLTDIISAYLDPGRVRFSKMRLENEIWEGLVEEFKTETIKKSDEYLSKAKFNGNEKLKLRKYEVQTEAKKVSQQLINQHQAFENRTNMLQQNLDKMLGDLGDVHVAISFDEKGEVKETAIV